MKSFIAVTDNYQEALKFGIHEDLIINLWDWLGGTILNMVGRKSWSYYCNWIQKFFKVFTRSKSRR